MTPFGTRGFHSPYENNYENCGCDSGFWNHSARNNHGGAYETACGPRRRFHQRPGTDPKREAEHDFTANCPCNEVHVGKAEGYTSTEWDEWNVSAEGRNLYHWWADWIPTPEGQEWCYTKRWEAHEVVQAMVDRWGLCKLREGSGVIDVGGDPGFVAAELLRRGVSVTVVDPGFGVSGKMDKANADYFKGFDERYLRFVRQPFNDVFVNDPANFELLRGASAVVSLYPDEATDFCQRFTAQWSKKTLIIPCNECSQYFPPHEPTYEGFVKQMLEKDRHYVERCGATAYLSWQMLTSSPHCKTILVRTPAW